MSRYVCVALREIGSYEDDVMEQLLWTVRCDKVCGGWGGGGRGRGVTVQ